MKYAVVLALVVCAAAPAAVEKTGKTERTFTVGAGQKRLIVDNVFGAIDVTAVDGSAIQIEVDERWRAESDARMEAARRDVKLDMTQDGNTVRLYVDGPFRCKDGGVQMDRDAGYTVRFDFRIRVPRDTAVELKTINQGNVRLRGTAGDFDLRNVNGDIEAADVAGSGRAHTVNGPVRIAFRENPSGPSSFKTINGEVTLELQPDFAADLRLKSLNGDAFSDFPYTHLAAAAASGERKGTRWVYRQDRMSGIRIGNGGPEIRIETLNGPIRLLKREKQAK